MHHGFESCHKLSRWKALDSGTVVDNGLPRYEVVSLKPNGKYFFAYLIRNWPPLVANVVKLLWPYSGTLDKFSIE